MDMKIRTYTGGMAQTNAYLLGENDNCILIDAPEGTDHWLREEGVTPCALLLTHQHYDHVEAAAAVSALDIPIYAYSDYSTDLTLEKLLQQSGIPMTVTPYKVEHRVDAHTALEIGNWKFSLEHIPGHSPDSVVYLHEHHAFVGDTIFAGSIGRTDLPGGDTQTLVSGISKKLLNLADATTIYPGHGPTSKIGTERASNPFL